MNIVEATLIIPITFFIIIGLIGVVMHFYQDFESQIYQHNQEREELYLMKEVAYIRGIDKLGIGIATYE